jgi:hypothetical protein
MGWIWVGFGFNKELIFDLDNSTGPNTLAPCLPRLYGHILHGLLSPHQTLRVHSDVVAQPVYKTKFSVNLVRGVGSTNHALERYQKCIRRPGRL